LISFRQIAALGAAAMMAAASPAFCQIYAQALPMKYNLTVRAGEPVARAVTSANRGETPVVVRVRLSDWHLDAAGEMQFAPPGTSPRTLLGHVQFEPREFSLGPGESGMVHVTMTLPDDGVATRWGLLLSEVRPAFTDNRPFGPRAVAELGTTLYLSKVPPQVIQADVEDMSIESLGGDSVRVTVRVRNKGERHFYVAGEMALVDSTGATRAGGRLPTGVILPQGVRYFTWASRAGLSPGDYTAAATLDTGEPELTVGELRFHWPLPPPRLDLPVASQ